MAERQVVTHEDIALSFATDLYLKGRIDVAQYEHEVTCILADHNYAVQLMSSRPQTIGVL
jgi:hypothetical protein